MSLLLTPAQAREVLGPAVVSRNRLYSWLRAGLVPSVRDGGRLFLSRAAVERLAEEIAQGRWPGELVEERREVPARVGTRR